MFHFYKSFIIMIIQLVWFEYFFNSTIIMNITWKILSVVFTMWMSCKASKWTASKQVTTSRSAV